MKDLGKMIASIAIFAIGLCMFFVSISNSEGEGSNTNTDKCKNNDDYDRGYRFGRSVIGDPTVRDPETFIKLSGYSIEVTECLKRGFYDGFYQKRSIND